MGSEPLDESLRKAIRQQNEAFLDEIEPIRPDLFRYCRSLTGNLWDAEDLVQETALKAFAKLGHSSLAHVESPRAYLFRTATNLWIDQMRRSGKVTLMEDVPETPENSEAELGLAVEDALKLAAQVLSPNERVTLLLKDVFGFSHSEVASYTGRSITASKVTLHRARERLKSAEAPTKGVSVQREPAADPLLQEFVAAFNARDMERLTGLMLEDATATIQGVLDEDGREEILGNSIMHTLFDTRGSEATPFPADSPRAELVTHNGEVICVLWYPTHDADSDRKEPCIGDVIRFTRRGDKLIHINYYYFSPEILKSVAASLGVRSQSHGYRFKGF